MGANWEYKWRAQCRHIIDGDTIDLYIDKGFRNYSTNRIRLAGINCPEPHAPTRTAADSATAYTQAWISAQPDTEWPLTVVTYKTDSFDRYVAVITPTAGGQSLNDALIASGNAVPFMVDKVER